MREKKPRETRRAARGREGPNSPWKSPPDVFPRMKTCGFHGRCASGTSSMTCRRLFVHSLLTALWKKSSGRFSTDENLRFSRTLRVRHVIHDVPTAVCPQPAKACFIGRRGPETAGRRRESSRRRTIVGPGGTRVERGGWLCDSVKVVRRQRGSVARHAAVSGRGAVWLARLTGGQEVAGSSPVAPT